jgi:2'-5' RNA ligase
MPNLRAFIAIELPSEIQSAIYKATAGLHQAFDRSLVRWVAQHNLHLTLKFLGDVSPSKVERLQQRLLSEAVNYQPFDLQVGGLGSFPSPKRPRVIWIGIQAPPGLASLRDSIESAVEGLGFPREGRSFSPHLTIGRVNQRASGADQQRLAVALKTTKVGPLGTALVEAVLLFKSELKSGGPVYTKLFSAPLIDPTHTR